MEFYAVSNQKRPKRLSEKTREFARESQLGKYGDEAMKTPTVSLDHIADFDSLSPLKQYDIAIREIAEKAPVHLCQNELISGAATLGAAILHKVPATRNGKLLWQSVSHLTLGLDKVLQIGINGIEKEIDAHLEKNHVLESQLDFYESLKNTIQSFRLWHTRCLKTLEEQNSPNYAILKDVPFQTPKSFHEAVQSLWFTFAFTRLTGNWPGIGRIDKMLGGFLKSDLASKRITLDEAREILAHFFIKGCEWIRSAPPEGSGDAQHYQNIVLSGIDESGNDVTNEVTYLVLDIIEELNISDFPVSVRINRNTPDKLLKRISEVIKLGGGRPMDRCQYSRQKKVKKHI